MSFLDKVVAAVTPPESENDRFLDLKQLSSADQARLTQRYAEEFGRYTADEQSAPARVNEISEASITAFDRQHT